MRTYLLITALLLLGPNLVWGDGTRFILEVASSGKPSVDRELTKRSIDVLRNRLQTTGEPDSLLEQKGERRIIVSIGKSGDEALDLIKQTTRTSRLEFRLVVDNADPTHPPANAEVLDETVVNAAGMIEGQPYVVLKKPLLAGDILAHASISVDAITHRPYLALEFTKKGAEQLEKATTKAIGRRMAIVLDRNIISVAVVQTPISGGRMQLTGNFTAEIAQDYATALESNYLPATIRIVSHGPSASGAATRSPSSSPPLRSDVDTSIPRGIKAGAYDVAVVIGNRNYSASGSPDVDFAANDARAMRDYLVTAFGFDPANIIYLEDATLTRLNEVFGTREDHRGKLFKWVKPAQSRVFIYYAGHGAPDQETGEAYFVPVDADPQYIRTGGYKLSTFYDNLAKIPALQKTVVIDACFSGSTAKGLLFKGVSGLVARLKAEPGAASATDLLLTSTGTNQVAGWYPDKRHSLFTYFFLKGMQGEADSNKDGRITLGELKTYLNDKVPYMARRLTGNEQQPGISGNEAAVLVDYNN